jgi:hypothetical protein
MYGIIDMCSMLDVLVGKTCSGQQVGIAVHISTDSLHTRLTARSIPTCTHRVGIIPAASTDCKTKPWTTHVSQNSSQHPRHGNMRSPSYISICTHYHQRHHHSIETTIPASCSSTAVFSSCMSPPLCLTTKPKVSLKVSPLLPHHSPSVVT